MSSIFQGWLLNFSLKVDLLNPNIAKTIKSPKKQSFNGQPEDSHAVVSLEFLAWPVQKLHCMMRREV